MNTDRDDDASGETLTVSDITVVIPCFNEVDNVIHSYREIAEELADYRLQFLYVDDGSTDGTLREIRQLSTTDPRVQFISFTRNYGFEAAFSAGYRYAGNSWVLHIDADQQFPASEAKVLIAEARKGYDAVFGVRTNRQDPRLRRWGTAAFHFIGRRMLAVEMPEGATAFRLVRTDLARRVVDLELGTPYFLATVPRLTSRYTTVPVAHRARQRGISKVGFGFLAGHAIELFVGFTRRLATAVSMTAVGATGLAVLFALAAATGMFGGGTLSAATFAVLGVVLMVLSLVMRYLVVVGAGQPRPRQYYIREASIAVDEADLLLAGPIPDTQEVNR